MSAVRWAPSISSTRRDPRLRPSPPCSFCSQFGRGEVGDGRRVAEPDDRGLGDACSTPMGRGRMSFGIALAAVALSGFISLSYEILWYRAVTLASGAAPVSFGLLLGFYLFGLALRGTVGGKWCRAADGKRQSRLLRGTAIFVLSANASDISSCHAFALFGAYGVWVAALILAMVAAAMFGAVLAAGQPLRRRGRPPRGSERRLSLRRPISSGRCSAAS